MKGSRTYRIHTLIVAIVLAACQPDEILPLEVREPSIDAEVQVYVDRFVEEANKRGVNVDVSDLGISVREHIHPVRAAGACHYFSESEHPHIYIDTTSLNWQHSEYTREMLVFHELGHCLLDRDHRVDLLENGNYASLMRSDKGVLFGTRLNAYKRAYYLDELFNENQGPPGWSALRDTAQIPSNSIVFQEDFEDNRYNWKLGNTGQSRREIENDALHIQSLAKGAIFTGKHISISPYQDFEVEAKIRLVEGNRPVLLQWGGDSPESLFYFGYGADRFAMLGHTQTGIIGGRTHPALRTNGFNHLRIRKTGNTYTFFINNEVFDQTQFEPLEGDLWGFYIGSYGKIEISHFSIKK
ncbi:MAG: hypothetical protein AAF694_22090 [Bacteroidota bacterium]